MAAQKRRSTNKVRLFPSRNTLNLAIYGRTTALLALRPPGIFAFAGPLKALASAAGAQYRDGPSGLEQFLRGISVMLAITHVRPVQLLRGAGLLVAGLVLAGCGINTIPTLQEQEIGRASCREGRES